MPTGKDGDKLPPGYPGKKKSKQSEQSKPKDEDK